MRKIEIPVKYFLWQKCMAESTWLGKVVKCDICNMKNNI